MTARVAKLKCLSKYFSTGMVFYEVTGRPRRLHTFEITIHIFATFISIFRFCAVRLGTKLFVNYYNGFSLSSLDAIKSSFLALPGFQAYCEISLKHQINFFISFVYVMRSLTDRSQATKFVIIS